MDTYALILADVYDIMSMWSSYSSIVFYCALKVFISAYDAVEDCHTRTKGHMYMASNTATYISVLAASAV